ncbi:MAG TPA: hypothetical protein VK879_19150 [Candidatus Sulfomarinibacteraceae bacterium]|nr:hypothetical protein [Candidatus Sulfomarinibacteraceae bacterium]
MRPLRVLFTVVILLFVFVGHFHFTSAAPTTLYSVHVKDATIPWGFPVGEFCPDFPQPLDIGPDAFGSDRVKHATELVMSDGSKRVVVTDLVKGTASDEFGGAYTFVYQNDATFSFDGSTIHVSMKDTFRLNGPTSYTVGFNWRWAFPADHLMVTEVVENGQTVDIQVSPNLPPTEDGLVEAPFIVPGSWQQLSTRGDPWNCDPL